MSINLSHYLLHYNNGTTRPGGDPNPGGCSVLSLSKTAAARLALPEKQTLERLALLDFLAEYESAFEGIAMRAIKKRNPPGDSGGIATAIEEYTLQSGHYTTIEKSPVKPQTVNLGRGVPFLLSQYIGGVGC